MASQVVEVKRGRGRPPKFKKQPIPEVDAFSAGQDVVVKKRKGRPPKAKNESDVHVEMGSRSVQVKRGRGRPPKAKKEPSSEVGVFLKINTGAEDTMGILEPPLRPKGLENSFKQILKRAREKTVAEATSELPAGKYQRVNIQGKGMISPETSQVLALGTSPETAGFFLKPTTVSPPTPANGSSISEKVKPRRLFSYENKSTESVMLAADASQEIFLNPTPKKAKAKGMGIGDHNDDCVFEKRKSSRLADLAEKEEGSKSKRKKNKKGKVPKHCQQVVQKERSPTCKIGKIVQEGQGRRHFKTVVFEGVQYRVGDDVYVRIGWKDDTSNVVNGNPELMSDSDEEVEDCVLCGETGKEIMIECDECLGGYHLGCLDPPLKEVPEGDWMCSTCDAIARGENVVRPRCEKRRRRTARERFLAQEIGASRIEKIWREKDGALYFQGRWWALPEETADGRQSWHGRREVFRSNVVDENEMDTIYRHCYVMTPEEYLKSGHEGDDVFMCGHEYDFRHQTFKRIVDEFADVSEVDDSEDESFDPARRSRSHKVDSDDDSDDNDEEYEDEFGKSNKKGKGRPKGRQRTARAANVRKGHAHRIEGIGAKQVPRARKRPLTELEKAKAALGLSAVPASLPCREKEKTEIEAFVKDAVAAGEDCLGRCLYISGVPGTGKTATVLEVMKGLRSKVDNGDLPPYRFVEINGLRLPSPEHAYTVLHEALTGQHCGWRRALQFLDARFSDRKPLKGVHGRPCILLVDELDLLVTRNQSVLYNLFDWPSRANSRLIVIGIANTMDLPERMLPRIASRLGLHRISFGPYSHTQLQQILATRLEGIPAFDKQAVEFASRKVAAVSGDARRALELCRRAVEITELRTRIPPTHAPTSAAAAPPSALETRQEVTCTSQSTNKLIGMSDIEAAITEMFQAPHIQFMKRCSKYSKIFLVAMVIEQHRTTMVETTFEKIVTAFMRLCGTHKESCPGVDSLLSVGCKLGVSRLLLCEPCIRHRHQKLQLNFPCDDVSFALKDDKDLPWLAKYL